MEKQPERPFVAANLAIFHYERNKIFILLCWRPSQKIVGNYTANFPRSTRLHAGTVNKILVLWRLVL